MEKIKCKFCGNEFDNSVLTVCPRCFKSQITSERILKFIWKTIFYSVSLACAAFLCFGIYCKLGNDSFWALPFFVLYILSIIKMQEFKKEKVTTKLKHLLQNTNLDNDPVKFCKIVKEIENEFNFK